MILGLRNSSKRSFELDSSTIVKKLIEPDETHTSLDKEDLKEDTGKENTMNERRRENGSIVVSTIPQIEDLQQALSDDGSAQDDEDSQEHQSHLASDDIAKENKKLIDPKNDDTTETKPSSLTIASDEHHVNIQEKGEEFKSQLCKKSSGNHVEEELEDQSDYELTSSMDHHYDDHDSDSGEDSFSPKQKSSPTKVCPRAISNAIERQFRRPHLITPSKIRIKALNDFFDLPLDSLDSSSHST